MKAKAAIRALTDAVDGVPIHVRQLSEMFRKHGQKQNRNNSDVQNLDSADMTHPLQTGWKNDGAWEPDEIVAWNKGERPEPEDYLDADYIKQHLGQFENGGTHIYRTGSLEGYGPGNNMAADGSNTTYVFPTDQLRDLMQQAKTPTELAQALGLPENFFAGGDIELRDFAPHELDGLRMPSGNEGGTDPDKWIPGGYLPSGIPEAVIDIPDFAKGTNNGIYNPGEWPGSPRPFSL
ncbi:hypothetical protein ACSS7Z_02825 [Microbacterium sp. A82]|uniref:hypothetical protein n=1 Tax=Microbacterium sp. A82 TaxID=3450452 RepID=UPI003F3D6CA3